MAKAKAASVSVPLVSAEDEKTVQQEPAEQVGTEAAPVDLPVPETYSVINNETDSFIGITSTVEGVPNLIIAPFGSRTLNSRWLDDYALLDWSEQKLISIEHLGANENDFGSIVAGLLVIAYGLFLLISIPLNLIFHSISWRTIGIVSLASLVLIILTFYVSEKRAQAEREGRKIRQNISGWLKLLPGILLILATGIGLPFAAVYFFGDGRQLIEAAPQLASLGRWAQVGFIVIASILPALFFYLFGRQQVEIQKDNFYKEVMSLDPNVHSLTETKTKYEDLIDSVYGSGNSPLSILLLFISTALLVMGWIMVMGTLDRPALGAISLLDFFIPERTVFTFGVLGAYFFTLNMVFRRYVRADLTPKTYAHITVRLLVTIVLVWVVSNLPQFKAGSIFESGMFAIAFIIGVIPETGLTLIQDYVRKLTNIGEKDQDILSLNQLEGIHLYDRARLLEEGIENIENLAHHNMIELIARTRIPTPRLVDMFDQAILYLHLGLEDEENRKFLATLKSYGIRTATDLDVALGVESSYNSLKNITPPLPLDKMEVIFQAFLDDEWYDHIVQWRLSSTKRKDIIEDPFEFYYPPQQRVPSREPVPPAPAAAPAA
jgi:hypothetical protein